MLPKKDISKLTFISYLAKLWKEETEDDSTLVNKGDDWNTNDWKIVEGDLDGTTTLYYIEKKADSMVLGIDVNIVGEEKNQIKGDEQCGEQYLPNQSAPTVLLLKT